MHSTYPPSESTNNISVVDQLDAMVDKALAEQANHWGLGEYCTVFVIALVLAYIGLHLYLHLHPVL